MGLLDDILGSFNSGQVSGIPPDLFGAPPSGALPQQPPDAPQPMQPMPGQNAPPDFGAGGAPMPRDRPPQADEAGIPSGLRYLLGGSNGDAPNAGAPAPDASPTSSYMAPGGILSAIMGQGGAPATPSDFGPGGAPVPQPRPPEAGPGANEPPPVMGQGGGTSANALDPYAPQSAAPSSTDLSARGRPPISVPLGPAANASPAGAAPAAAAQPAPSNIDSLIAQIQQRQNRVGPLAQMLGLNADQSRAISAGIGSLANVKNSPFKGEAIANGLGNSFQAIDKSDAEHQSQQVKLLDEAIKAKNSGNTDAYRQAMMALQQSRLAETQRQHTLVADKAPAGYFRNSDGTMSPIKGGPADPTQLAAVQKAKATGGALPDETADFLAERVLAGDSKALVNLGRGAQGAENIIKVQSLVAQKAAERGVSPNDILAKVAEQSGLGASQRTFGTQIAKMAVNSTEAEGAIQQGLEVSKKVDRTRFVPINKLIQMGEANISDPDLLEFRAANLAIINTYARAINPTGQPTIHDKQEAMKVVSEATSPEAYERVMNRMLKEIDIAHKAPVAAKAEMERIRKSGTDPAATAAAGTAPAAAVPAEGTIATNPKTGARLIRQNGQWAPLP